MNNFRLSISLIGLLAVSAVNAWGAAGDLDPTFGDGGKVVTGLGGTNSLFPGAIAVQRDGKIIVVGNDFIPGSFPDGNFAIIRYNIDGSLDTSFGENGRVSTDFLGFLDSATGIAIQSDGRIVVGGTAYNDSSFTSARFALARYNADGSLDPTFSGDGKVTTTFFGDDYEGAGDLLLQPDGKIVIVGSADQDQGQVSDNRVVLARFDEGGELDPSFGIGGKVLSTLVGSASSIDLQPDNKIVIGGTDETPANHDDFLVARFTASGELDSSFGTNGAAITVMGSGQDWIQDIAIQPDGKIVAVGTINLAIGDGAMIRLSSNGFLDLTFGNQGKVFSNFGTDSSGLSGVVIEPNGKIIAAGYAASANIVFALSRHKPDGKLDTSFGPGGTVTTSFSNIDQATAVALQPDGKIVVVGYAQYPNQPPSVIVLARYATSNAPFDYDGDGRTDLSVFRPSEGAWYLQRSTAGFQGLQFGSEGDKLTPADYDGDGKTDISIYRPSTGIWYILNSATGTVSYPVFGAAEDLPAPGDYDGDGKADLTVFRPSQGTWYRQNSSNGSFFGMQFGANGDVPTVGDFDGDGKDDLGIFRPSLGDWYSIRSSNGSVFGQRFGQTGDRIAQADYDGDGKTDIAIFRPSTGLWVVRNSATSTYSYHVFGSPADIPISGDYDGDGKADIGVWRPSDGTWYIKRSDNGQFIVFPWGQNGDRPTPAAYGN